MAESVSSVAFLPESPDLLVAGVANLSLRLYDLRTPGHKAQTAVPAKASGITTDPFKSSLFASYGDNTVSLWDWRKLAYPLLSFTSLDAAADGGRKHGREVFVRAEFSSTRAGTLATLSKGDVSVRFWDTKNSPNVDIDPIPERQRSRDTSRDGSRSSKLGRLSWSAPSLPWNAPADQSKTTTNHANTTGSIVLANTYHSKPILRDICAQ
jgi:WD40 repeat protein